MADNDKRVGDAEPLGADPSGKDLRARIIDYGYEELLFLEPSAYDGAIVGVAEDRCDCDGRRADVVVYDIERILDITHQMCGGSLEAAVHYVDINVTGGYVGEGTPIFVRSIAWFGAQ